MRMRNRKLRNRFPRVFTLEVVQVPWVPKVTQRGCALFTGSEGFPRFIPSSRGCYLRRPRHMLSMVTGTSPGYISMKVRKTHILARHFFNMEDDSTGVFFTEEGGGVDLLSDAIQDIVGLFVNNNQ